MVSVNPVVPPKIARSSPQNFADYNLVEKWNPLYNTNYNPMFYKQGAFFPTAMSKLSNNPGANYGINRGVKRGQGNAQWHINCRIPKQVIRDTLTRPQFQRLQTGAVGSTIRQQAMFEDTLAVGMPIYSPAVVV